MESTWESGAVVGVRVVFLNEGTAMFWAWVLGVTAVMILLFFFAYRLIFRRLWVAPSMREAIVFSGGGLWGGWRQGEGEDYRIVVGKPRLILPPHRHREVVDLGNRSITETVECRNSQMLQIIVPITLTFKIGSDEEQIQRAVQQFDPRTDALEQAVRNHLRDTVRTVVGNFDYTALTSDNNRLKTEVREQIRKAVHPYGLSLVSIGIIKDIDDKDGYGNSLRQIAASDRERHTVEANTRLEADKKQLEDQRDSRIYELTRKSQERQKQMAEIQADLDRQQNAFKQEKEMQAWRDALEQEQVKKELRLKELDREGHEERSRIELAKLDKFAIHDAEIHREEGLARAEAQRVIALARAEGIRIAAQVEGLTPAEAHELAMLTMAQNMQHIAAAARIELPNLTHMINTGAGSDNGATNLLANVAGMGLPVAEMLREMIGQFRGHTGAPSSLVPPPGQSAIDGNDLTQLPPTDDESDDRTG